GMYDYSGAWVYDVGMPAKSGVGGGIMAVLPGQFGVAVFSPLLDDIGNSARGIEVCRQISQDFNLHLFHTQRSTTSSVIRDRCDGSVARSRRTRHPEEKAILASNGHKIKMYSLQGELMFGAADAITQHIAHEMEETSCTVIDLNHVLDIDQASIRLFKELINKLHFDGKIILFTYTENKYGFMKQINKGVEILHDISVFEFSDNDRALEWCEDYLLKQERGIFDRFHIASLEKQKLCVGLSAAQIKILNACGKLVNLDEDEKLFSIDDPAHSLFFVLQGEMSVQLENKRGLPRRLTTVHAGMSVGELTLVNGQARSADVVAITPVELLEVDFASIPDDIESLFLRNIALQLSMKIAEDNHSQPLGN
ncbi:MAG: glutaminase, partial [Gammaproteobacteria bacterium]|nr:glutaminase [Gammaproteobacteria bacterium]